MPMFGAPLFSRRSSGKATSRIGSRSGRPLRNFRLRASRERSAFRPVRTKPTSSSGKTNGTDVPGAAAPIGAGWAAHPERIPPGKPSFPPRIATSTQSSRQSLRGSGDALQGLRQVHGPRDHPSRDLALPLRIATSTRSLRRSPQGSGDAPRGLRRVRCARGNPSGDLALPSRDRRKHAVLEIIPSELLSFPAAIVASTPPLKRSLQPP